MNVNSIIIIFTIVFKENVIYCTFIPSIASHPGYPIMHNTDNGWVQNHYIIKNPKNGSEFLQLCQRFYPELNIINVMKMFKTEFISNWNHRNAGSDSPNNSFNVHPFRCINAGYSDEKINIPAKCKIFVKMDEKCQPFDHWKNASMRNCTKDQSYLYNMNQIYSASLCKNSLMHFQTIDFICCKADLEYYQKLLNSYLEKKHKERPSFSKLKHALVLVYDVRLNDLNSYLDKEIKSLFRNNKHDKNSFDNGLKRLKQNFKWKYENNSLWYSDQFLQIEETHINRITDKINHHCKFPNEKKEVPSLCIHQINSTIDQLRDHHKHVSNINSRHPYNLNNLLIKEIDLMKKKYLNELQIPKNVTDKLQKFIEYLKLTNRNLTVPDTFEKEFQNCISRNKPLMKFDLPVKHSHSTPIMSIIVTTVILLILIVLTFIATLVIKCCGQPLRRSSPNYVMSVVFNANQNQGPIHRSDQQISSNSSKQDVKLNLYENPIFNAKSVGKSIEKQSLIENMES